MGMADRVRQAEQDENVKVIIVRGRGNTFCSGFDLNMVEGQFLSGRVNRPRAPLEMVTQVSRVYNSFHDVIKPTVAVVEGFCTAGGFELMISCDFAIAANDAQIGDFHINRGMTGGGGPIYRLPRIVGLRRAKELMLTGKLVSGKKAAEWNLVNESHPPDELNVRVEEFVEPLKRQSSYIMWITKQTANCGLDADPNTLMVMEHYATACTMQSNDAAESVRSFLEKREPVWTNT
jgi:enoyl-CoA hydratase